MTPNEQLEAAIYDCIKENNGKFNIWDLWDKFKDVDSQAVNSALMRLKHENKVEIKQAEIIRPAFQYKYFICSE